MGVTIRQKAYEREAKVIIRAVLFFFVSFLLLWLLGWDGVVGNMGVTIRQKAYEREAKVIIRAVLFPVGEIVVPIETDLDQVVLYPTIFMADHIDSALGTRIVTSYHPPLHTPNAIDVLTLDKGDDGGIPLILGHFGEPFLADRTRLLSLNTDDPLPLLDRFPLWSPVVMTLTVDAANLVLDELLGDTAETIVEFTGTYPWGEPQRHFRGICTGQVFG